MGLEVFWFIAIVVLWTGFFVLEGFDFGVGILHGVVARNDLERRVVINTIGPLWDGNEVWLIVAGAAIFAAFPGWYATMFSALYLALVLVLAALIARGVSFEFRGKGESPRWRTTWSRLLTTGSLLAPFLIGVGLGDLLHGLPIGKDQEYTGGFVDLLAPYSLFVGLTFVLLCVLHGAAFLSLRTTGDIRERAHAVARRFTVVTGLAVLVFGVWTQITLDRGAVPDLIPVAAVLAIVAVAWLLREGREGWAFAMTTFAMAATVVTIFIDLYPRVMVSSTDPANSLTVENTASSSYTLTVMTIVAVVFLPIVLVYQAWTYHVFRQRLGPSDLGEPESGAESTEAAGPEPAGAASSG
jgi:cytochrome d ubiquinol oxidase subunit II